MPFPDFINIGDPAAFSLSGSANLLLASIAFEEFALANLINAEAEKIQYILGTLEGQITPNPPATLEEVLEVNHCADRTLRDIIKKEILLQLKMESVLGISSDAPAATCPACTTSTTSSSATMSNTSASMTTSAPCVESAWVVGIDFGPDCAQYTTLDLGELCKAVDLNLSCQRVAVGTVKIIRCGTDLVVTISVNEPYLMDQVYLYVGNAPPADSNPEDFPYRFTGSDPADYFKHHTFTVDVSGFLGQTLYISVFARVRT